MNRGIYSVANGMVAAQKWMDTVTNNLANVSTTGFKRDGVAFNDAFASELRADGGRGAPIGTLGSGPEQLSEYTVLGEVGPISATGNPLDVAITIPDALFAVDTGDGAIRYTRNGSFSRNADGQLVTQQGHLVLDDRERPIDLGEGQVEISQSGELISNGASIGKIGLFKGAFTKVGGNLFAGNGAAVESVELTPKSLEGSNVNAIESMVQMIQLNRTFELSQKTISQQDDLTQRLIQSLQDR